MVSDSLGWRIVEESPTICLDCIAVEELIVLGDDEGPGYHEESHWATIDGLGNYWVGAVDGPRVYSPSGTFLRRVGRAGQGPLEFASAGPIYTDTAGRVHVFDPRNARETILGRDFTVDHEFRLAGGWLYEATPLPGEDRKLVNMIIRTPDQLGFPLHTIDGSEIEASFGTQGSGSLTLATMSLLRRLAVDGRGTIYSGAYFEYSVEMWTPTGRRIAGIKRPGLWEPPPDGQPRPLSRGDPLRGLLLAMRVDDSDRLWIIAWVPRDDWQDHVREVQLPNGMVALQPENSNASLYRTAIEVIDLNEAMIVARIEFDEVVEGFFGSSRLFGNRITEAGTPQFVVWRVLVNGQLAQDGGWSEDADM